MSVVEIMAATERTDRNAIDQLLFKMGRDGEIKRVRRGIYSLPEEAGKIGKKERNGTQGPEISKLPGNLTNLTDLTGAGEISPEDWTFHLDEATATATRNG